jgi:zinc/manganese transport system substrate-binding protein
MKSTNVRIRSLLLVGLVTVVAGAARAEAEVDVVTTVPTLAALVREIGGAHVKVSAMALPTQDPHFVDAKPSLALALNRADLLVAVGLGLEAGWLPTLQTGARNPAIQRGGAGFLECSIYVATKDVPTEKVDRSMGDIHPGGNPHYLYDPRSARGCASAIAARLGALDPRNAGAYRAAYQAFDRALEGRLAGWTATMKPLAGRSVIVYHRSWIYLTDWLGLREVAELEPKPGIPPSARHIAAVIERARAERATVILQESYYPARTAALVAKQIGGKVVAVPSGPDVNRGETYFQHVDRVVGELARAMGSK